MNYTVLVNKDNKIKSNYLNRVKLVSTSDYLGNEVFVEEETFKSYQELKIFLATKGIVVEIDSSYRSISEQEELYNEYLLKYGSEYVSSYVALAGFSEHHTGLAVDLAVFVDGVLLDKDIDPIKYELVYSKIHKYLSKFGFILRYPNGKENVTGYLYEAWHIRYVGKFISKIIFENNYTLEEYLCDFGGVLVVNKPKGITSFDVVNEISHLFGIKRVGHTGTLDPMAQGVLVVTIGKACKVVELLSATYKEYEAGVLLGVLTDTLDITGNVLKTKVVPYDLDVMNTLLSFKKTYMQEVPIYSAVKVNGKKLYDYARNNESVVLPKKEVTISEIELLGTDKNTFHFRCLVSKGCYIRSLIRDIASSLDTYGTMTSLIRTKQGKFSLDEACTVLDLKNGKYHLYNIDEVLDYPIVEVDTLIEDKVRTGQKIKNTFSVLDKVIFKSKCGQLLGIYEVEDNIFRVWKNFV